MKNRVIILCSLLVSGAPLWARPLSCHLRPPSPVEGFPDDSGCFRRVPRLRLDFQAHRFSYEDVYEPNADCHRWPPYFGVDGGLELQWELGFKLIPDANSPEFHAVYTPDGHLAIRTSLGSEDLYFNCEAEKGSAE